MATVNEVILRINANDATLSINDMRAALKQARSDLNGAKVGTTEYKQALAETTAIQNGLSNATKVGTTAISETDKSYNALSRTMAQLKQEWKATNDEALRSQLGAKINDINDELKRLDAGVGVFSRNVGNYEKSFVGAFQSMGGAAASVIAPVQGVTTGLQVLSKTPVIAIIGLLINLLSGAVKAFKSSEEGAASAGKAFDGFKVIANLLTKGMQLLGKGVTWVAEGFTTLLKKVGLLGEESEKNAEIGQKEIELAKERRRVTMENADTELKISKLRAEAADKVNIPAKERMKLLKEAADLEESIYKNNHSLAQKEYDLIQKKNALLPSSSQELQEEADAYANMVEAEQRYFDKQRELNGQIAEAFNQAKTQAKELAEEVQKIPTPKIVDTTNYDEDQWEEEYEERFYAQQALMDEHHAEMKKKNDQALKEELDRNLKELQEKEKLEKAKDGLKKNGLKVTMAVAQAAAKLVGEETAFGKGVAIAQATIDTYKAANSAYSAMASIPYVGPALGAAAAAAAVMSGIANVKQILSVKTDGTSTSMPSAGATVQTAAPAVIQQVPVVRSLTGASEEARLNQILDNTSQTATGVNQPIKAYVVQSEMEGEQLYADSQRNESSF